MYQTMWADLAASSRKLQRKYLRWAWASFAAAVVCSAVATRYGIIGEPLLCAVFGLAAFATAAATFLFRSATRTYRKTAELSEESVARAQRQAQRRV